MTMKRILFLGFFLVQASAAAAPLPDLAGEVDP